MDGAMILVIIYLSSSTFSLCNRTCSRNFSIIESDNKSFTFSPSPDEEGRLDELVVGGVCSSARNDCKLFVCCCCVGCFVTINLFLEC